MIERRYNMEKDNEKKEVGEGDTEGDSGDGNKPKVPEAVRLANEAAERMEEANRVREEIITREEDLAAHNQLGGSSEAGKEPVKAKEETNKEYKDRVMSGNA